MLSLSAMNAGMAHKNTARRRSGRKMLGVPVGLEVRVDLAVDYEDAGRPFAHPCLERIKIRKGSDRHGTGAVAACNGGKIRLRELHDIDCVALPSKVVHLRGVGAIVVDENAKPQLKAQRGFEVRNRHQEAAVAGTEHGKLAGIGHCEANGRSKAKANRLKRMAEARCARARHPQVTRDPATEMARIGGDDPILRQDRVDRLAQRPRINEPDARFVAMWTPMIVAGTDART